MTITVHHLNNSRSQRILWLLEELRLPYEIVNHTRKMMQAPASMAAVHPLGKSPIITDGDAVIAESGAIAEYLVRKAGGSFGTPHNADGQRRYSYYMHYPEGSLMPMLVMAMVVGKLPPLGWLAAVALRKQLRRQLAFVNDDLEGRSWIAGDAPSAADAMLSFPLEFANKLMGVGDYPNLVAYLARIHARPAYAAAMARGGPTIYR
jgi:glutathione S-transferase